MGFKIEMNLGDEFTIIQLNRWKKHNEAVAIKFQIFSLSSGNGGGLENNQYEKHFLFSLSAMYFQLKSKYKIILLRAICNYGMRFSGIY